MKNKIILIFLLAASTVFACSKAYAQESPTPTLIPAT
jgi:hypothetical protein